MIMLAYLWHFVLFIVLFLSLVLLLARATFSRRIRGTKTWRSWSPTINIVRDPRWGRNVEVHGPSTGALDAESPKRNNSKHSKTKEERIWHEINVFLKDLHHVLHARSCIHFLRLPFRGMLQRSYTLPRDASAT